jgi:ankyrin repeat protein
MIGNDQVRFCEHCALHVTDLSAMTRRKAMDFVARSEGRVCVRFIQAPNGRVLTRSVPEKLYRIQRRVSRLAASAFTATLSVSTAIAQSSRNSSADQPRPVAECVQPETEVEKVVDEFTASVTGTVTKAAEDENAKEGVPISEATVVLVDRETGEERIATTTALGQYWFQLLPQGKYVLWARKSGFATETRVVTVTANAPLNEDLELYERRMGYGLAGAMASRVGEPEDALFKAVTENDVETVRNLVATDQELNRASRRDGESLLNEAVGRGNPQVVEMLLAFGADVNLRNASSYTPLMNLNSVATPDLARKLIAAGARINARDDSGASALIHAAGLSPTSVVKELIAAGANVNARDDAGENCLFSAARSKNPQTISLLLESGVDLNVRNDEGEDALMVAAASGDFESFRILYARSTSANLLNEDRRTLLMLAIANEDPKVAKMLLEAGAPVNPKDNFGHTALMLAAQAGREDTLSLLIAAGADVNEHDEQGETALMMAVAANDSDCVAALLKAGADLNAKNQEGKTALAMAREYENSDVVKLLKSPSWRH